MKTEYKINLNHGSATADISRNGIVFLSEGGGPSELEAKRWALFIIEQVGEKMENPVLDTVTDEALHLYCHLLRFGACANYNVGNAADQLIEAGLAKHIFNQGRKEIWLNEDVKVLEK